MPEHVQVAAPPPPAVLRPQKPQILQPFDIREAITVREYAALAGVSITSARTTIHEQGLGRKVSGQWRASRVLAAMYLDGDRDAMRAYWAGNRTSDPVGPYFERFSINPATLGRGV